MAETQIRRSRTALKRTSLSRPIALALADGLIDSDKRVLDYGCGKGDDVRLLAERGIAAVGWDPAFAPGGEKSPSAIVNLGYVVNVIEDGAERVVCLKEAWALATDVLVVAARLSGEVEVEGFAPFADGSLTRRGTFQKFYEQEELRSWIEAVVGESPVAAAPGIFYAFRNADAREAFVSSRYRRRLSAPRVRLSDRLYEECKEILAPLEAFFLARGRLPSTDELECSSEITARFGSIARAFRVVRYVTGDDAWTPITEGRREDLLVYGALSRFGGRPRWSDLPLPTQKDIRAFFSTYRRLCDAGDELLFAAGRRDVLDRAMRSAPVGKLTPSALYVHRTALDALPPVLRAYEGCARTLSGEVPDANVLKLSRTDAKVSYLSYPTFDRDPHPALHRTVVVYPGALRIHYRDYASMANPPILHRKEEFVESTYPGRDKFARLTTQEERAGLFDSTDRIGSRDGWLEVLGDRGVEVRGHRVVRTAKVSRSTLGLDEQV